jgi:hypothetical protein
MWSPIPWKMLWRLDEERAFIVPNLQGKAKTEYDGRQIRSSYF